MYAALAGVYEARWTAEIHAEWMRNVAENHSDISLANLARVRDLMNKHVTDANVTGYEHLIAALTLPDPDDRHVLAAAVRCGARYIITFNRKDFPAAALQKHGIAALHPDVFLSDRFAAAPDALLEAARKHRESLKRPPHDADEFLLLLARQGLAKTALKLKRFADRL